MQRIDIPSAVETLTTVRLLAPVARYAQGNFSTDLRVSGALGKDMMPLYEVLTGQGTSRRRGSWSRTSPRRPACPLRM